MINKSRECPALTALMDLAKRLQAGAPPNTNSLWGFYRARALRPDLYADICDGKCKHLEVSIAA